MFDIHPLSPINFFQIACDCYYLKDFRVQDFPFLGGRNYKKYLLPKTSALSREKTFADVAMGWHEEGVEFYVRVEQPYEKCSYPNIQAGDSVELFIDTRDNKNQGFNSRFCHHFFFLPESMEGIQSGEITRFRTEDSHPLCDAADLKVKVRVKSNEYEIQIFVPNHCLIGYDPGQFKRLGFSYRINRTHGAPQHFSVLSDEYSIEQQPALWGSLSCHENNAGRET